MRERSNDPARTIPSLSVNAAATPSSDGDSRFGAKQAQRYEAGSRRRHRRAMTEDEYDPSTLEVSVGLVRYYEWLLDRISRLDPWANSRGRGRHRDVVRSSRAALHGTGPRRAGCEPLPPARRAVRRRAQRGDVLGTLEQAVATQSGPVRAGVRHDRVVQRARAHRGRCRHPRERRRALLAPRRPPRAVRAEPAFPLRHDRRRGQSLSAVHQGDVVGCGAVGGPRAPADRVLRLPRHRPVVHLRSCPAPHARRAAASVATTGS